MSPEELTAMVRYQVGALQAFVSLEQELDEWTADSLPEHSWK